MATPHIDTTNSTAAIFARVWEGASGNLSATVARHILKLGFGSDDKRRMQELLERNREATLTAIELEELDNFVKVGDLLAILQSKARKALKRSTHPRAAHG
ncbi:MAG: hypothetical protein K8U57_35540 [Planctomycetes bacterium]|nr:hypothetical protein [Planctomycetota bacterium]